MPASKVFALAARLAVLAAAATASSTDSCVFLPAANLPSLSDLSALDLLEPVSAALDDIQSLVDEFSSSNGDMAVTAVLGYQDSAWLTVNSGVAKLDDNGNPQAPDDDTVWRVGGVTGVVTALLYQMFLEAGNVTTLTKVYELIPDYPKQGVKLQALASQIAGLQLSTPMPCERTNCSYTTAELLPNMGVNQLYTPDIRASYSDFGLALLGRTLETLMKSGEQYEDYVTNNILTPLGMTSAGFDLTAPNVLENLATGSADAAALSDLGWANPSAGLLATTADMAKFLEFLGTDIRGCPECAHPLPDTPVLTTTQMKEWFKPEMLNPDGQSGYGSPWEFLRGPNQWLLTKAGAIDYFSSHLAFDPNSRVGVWVTANRNTASESAVGAEATTLANQIVDALFPAVNTALSEWWFDQVPAVPSNFLGTFSTTTTTTTTAAATTTTHTIYVTRETTGVGRLALNANIYGQAYGPMYVLDSGYGNDTAIVQYDAAALGMSCFEATQMAFNGEMLQHDPTTDSLSLAGVFQELTFARQATTNTPFTTTTATPAATTTTTPSEGDLEAELLLCDGQLDDANYVIGVMAAALAVLLIALVVMFAWLVKTNACAKDARTERTPSVTSIGLSRSLVNE